MELHAVHGDCLVKEEPWESSLCQTRVYGDDCGISTTLGMEPLLFCGPTMSASITANDLFVFDHHSWRYLRGLVNLLEDEDTKYMTGCLTGCVFLSNDECRYAWTLDQCMSQYACQDVNPDNTCLTEFDWCIIPPTIRLLTESYVACRALHMGSIKCISAEVVKSKCIVRGSSVVNMNLVMMSARHLDFYVNQCFYLPFHDIADCVKHGLTMYKVASFGDYPLQIISVPWSTGNTKQACFSSSTYMHFEETVPIDDANTGTPDVEIDEMDLNTLKTELQVEEILEEGGIQEEQKCKLSQRTPAQHMKRKYSDFGKLIVLAKSYSDLYPISIDDMLCPFPTNFMPRSFILECPVCNIPTRCPSPKAFIGFLKHVSRKHSGSKRSLLDEIIDDYIPFIEHMHIKIEEKHRRKYVKKLRSHRYKNELIK